MKEIKKYFNALFPFFAVLFLWRLDYPFWNPCGVLAIIPIFYYSFIRKRDYFWGFALLGCFLMDSTFDTLLFWTTSFMIMYAVNSFQNYIDITRQSYDGLYPFMVFMGTCTLILGLWGAVSADSFMPLLDTVWLFLLTSGLYILFTMLAKRIER